MSIIKNHFQPKQKAGSCRWILLFCSFLGVTVIVCIIFLFPVIEGEVMMQAHANEMDTVYAISDTPVIQKTDEMMKNQNSMAGSEPTTEIVYGTVHVNDFVNIRMAPGTEAEILGKLYDGDEVIVIGTSFADHDWYQIKYGSLEGFAKAEYFDVHRVSMD